MDLSFDLIAQISHYLIEEETFDQDMILPLH